MPGAAAAGAAGALPAGYPNASLLLPAPAVATLAVGAVAVA